jgi:hypothetical protein
MRKIGNMETMQSFDGMSDKFRAFGISNDGLFYSYNVQGGVMVHLPGV